MTKFVKTHQPCEDCGSSDGKAYNEDGSGYCFVCNTYSKGTNKETIMIETSEFEIATYPAIANRGLSSATCKHYSILAKTHEVLFGYYDANGKSVAYKVRASDKTFKTSGNWREGLLFGQHLFPRGGRYLTITEGEFDAASVYQMTGSKYPVVSLRNGAGSALKDCKEQFEYIDSFENIVLCFDADDAGQRAAAQVGELFGSKCRIVKHKKGFKDASDYLQNGDGKDFNAIWWSAEQFVPDGLVNGATLLEEILKPMERAAVTYPYSKLQGLTYGIRPAELVTITAGSGLGKSQFLRELVYHVLNNTEENIGLLFLEESVRRTALSIAALSANKPLHLPDCDATDQEKTQAFEETLGTGRVYLLNHFGSTSVDNIVNRVRYMAKSLDCRYVFLDHISIVVSSQENGDERRAIDEIMTKLRMLVQETGISLFCVSHLKRPETKGHEEGAATSLAQLRGSGSIAQLSDMVIGLERNGQAEEEQKRNTTKVRVLKNRYSGLTGPAGNLLYNHSSGRMLEMIDEEEL